MRIARARVRVRAKGDLRQGAVCGRVCPRANARVVEWQTRTFEGRMPKGMRVQVPPRAPRAAPLFTSGRFSSRELGQDRFLHVQPALRLIENGLRVRFERFLLDFLTAMRRQA